MNIAFCGAGQFGFALLKHLERKFAQDPLVELSLYDIDNTLLDSLQNQRQHSFITGPNSSITEKVRVVRSLQELITAADVLVLAVNSAGLKDVFAEIRDSGKQGLALVNVAKALDEQARTYSQNASEALAGIEYKYAAFVGGSIAEDMLNGNPLGMTMASSDEAYALEMQKLFENETLKVYTETDIVGVELASSLKNIVSLAAGLVEGLGYAYGTVTYMIMSTAKELAAFAVRSYGAEADTFGMYTQHWGNDMWMSATGNTRNRKFGVLSGQGKTKQEAFAIMKTNTVESLFTLKGTASSPAFNDLIIIKEMYEIFITEKKEPKSFGEFIMKNKF